MDTAKITSLILCENITRGDGRDTPIRKVKKVFTTEGDLIAEHDPLTYSIEKIRTVLATMAPEATPFQFVEKLIS